MNDVIVAGAAAWIAGRWVGGAADLQLLAETAGIRAPIDVSAFASVPRIARADRLTRMAAMVAGRALHGIDDPSAVETRSVIMASALASADTNESFEQRRLRTGKPVPRDFPYTAPNAAAGELAAALQARGPSLSLVGGMEAGLAAIERACRWLRSGACDRVVVVAAECPPQDAWCVAPEGIEPVECAAVLVLDQATPNLPDRASLSANWLGSSFVEATPWAPMLSVGLVAAVVAAWFDRSDTDLSCWLPTGASIRVALRGRGRRLEGTPIE